MEKMLMSKFMTQQAKNASVLWALHFIKKSLESYWSTTWLTLIPLNNLKSGFDKSSSTLKIRSGLSSVGISLKLKEKLFRTTRQKLLWQRMNAKVSSSHLLRQAVMLIKCLQTSQKVLSIVQIRHLCPLLHTEWQITPSKKCSLIEAASVARLNFN